jgi:protein AroM
VTRLRDGSEIRVGEADILAGVQRGVDALQERADVILLLCTGPFPRLRSRKPLLVPDRILLHFVRGVVDHPRVGVLTPAEAQVPWQEARWRASLPETVEEIAVVSASPYGVAWREAFRDPLARLAVHGPGLVVMDCLGYDRAMRAAVRATLGVPVVLARTVLARAAAELLGVDAARS